MSLVSVHNFLSPIRSKAQIIGLLVLAFLVLIVRWVGNDSDSALERSERVSSKSPVAGPEDRVQVEVQAFLDAQEAKSAPKRARVGTMKDDDDTQKLSIEDLLAADPSDTAGSASDSSPVRADGSSKSLSDIRRSLGLE